uniref:Uncharacterized protein n=1 Tax=Peronospora matthiolae TaxID=2874970 RepID=A0AAV1T9H7_9STRA
MRLSEELPHRYRRIDYRYLYRSNGTPDRLMIKSVNPSLVLYESVTCYEELQLRQMDVALKCIAEAVRRTRGCVVSRSIEARVVPGMGTGIVARERIPKDTLVFQAGRDIWYPFSAEYALETAQQQAPGFLKRWEELLVSNSALHKGGAFVPKALVLGVHLLVNFPFAKNLETMLLTMANIDAAPLE